MVAAKISKIALLSLGCVSLASACFGGFTPKVLDAVELPDNVGYNYRFMGNDFDYESMPNYAGFVRDSLNSDRFTFDFGYTYYLWGFHGYYLTNSDGSIRWAPNTYFYWVKCSDSYSTSYMADSLFSPISFSSYSPSSGYYYVKERTNVGFVRYCYDAVYTTNMSLGATTFYPKGSYTNSYVETAITSTNSGPYSLYLDSYRCVEFLWPYIQSVTLSTDGTYVTGYNAGYQAGYGDQDTGGYHDGYDAGYDAGLVANNSPVNTMRTLFSIMMTFPIDILNGLNGFVVWDTPVMTILVTFLVMSLVLWVVKRLIK